MDDTPRNAQRGWYSCTHPGAHFMNNLVVTRVEGQSRLGINNREFVTRPLDGSAMKQELQSPEDLLDVLERRFGLSFPKGTIFRAPALDW